MPLSKKTLRVLVCDSSFIFSRGLASLLKENSKVSEVCAITEYKDLLKLIEEKTFNVIIIEDTFISGDRTTVVLSKIKKLCPTANTIVTSSRNETSLIDQYISKGAKGFIPKLSNDQIILSTILKVAGGATVSNNRETENLKAIAAKKTLEIGLKDFDLSDKEKEIMFMITEGKSNKIIAEELSIAERTVEFHKTNIYKKTNTKSLADLVLLTIVSRLL
jgi:DNA-binding NarL/FixJ family response regulator